MLGRLTPEDLDLLHWWPNGTLKQEKMVHSLFGGGSTHGNNTTGEWYHVSLLAKLVAYFTATFPDQVDTLQKVPLMAKGFGAEAFGSNLADTRPTIGERVFHSSAMVEYARIDEGTHNESISVWIHFAHVRVVNVQLRNWLLSTAGFQKRHSDDNGGHIISVPRENTSLDLLTRAALFTKKERDPALFQAFEEAVAEVKMLAPISVRKCVVARVEKSDAATEGMYLSTLSCCPTRPQAIFDRLPATIGDDNEWRWNSKFKEWWSSRT